MTVFSGLLAQLFGNWRLLASAFILLGVSLVGVQTFYAWYRLRHIKGPFLASFSKLWLIRTVSSGNMHWEYAKVCQKYGTHETGAWLCLEQSASMNYLFHRVTCTSWPKRAGHERSGANAKDVVCSVSVPAIRLVYWYAV